MKNLILLALSITLVSCSFAQNNEVTNSDLKEMAAEWTGNLSYLNYQDGKSIFKIPCTLETFFKNGKLETKVIYDELDENGKKMTAESSFHISKDGQYFMIGEDKWEIISSEKTDAQIRIVAKSIGEDNNRPSEFKTTVTLKKGESFVWTKDVRYEGTDNFFNRNGYSFAINQ